ncbi:hypothetical protein QJS66_04020 [Kocuria rhizophila]|nr:hypothetical protein QJS66_04020 [Kocuria rhizophila]
MVGLMEKEAATHYAAIPEAHGLASTALSEATGISRSEFEKLAKQRTFGIPERFPPTWRAGCTRASTTSPWTPRPADPAGDGGPHRATLERDDAEDRWFEVLTVGFDRRVRGHPQNPSVAGAIENRIDDPDGETSGFVSTTPP